MLPYADANQIRFKGLGMRPLSFLSSPSIYLELFVLLPEPYVNNQFSALSSTSPSTITIAPIKRAGEKRWKSR